MFPYTLDHLQLLLEQEADDLGNLSQHLAVLGIHWRVDIGRDWSQSDPSERCTIAVATLYEGERTWRGYGYQWSDLSGDWTLEEWCLQLLELALRDLWTRAAPEPVYEDTSRDWDWDY